MKKTLYYIVLTLIISSCSLNNSKLEDKNQNTDIKQIWVDWEASELWWVNWNSLSDNELEDKNQKDIKQIWVDWETSELWWGNWDPLNTKLIR